MVFCHSFFVQEEKFPTLEHPHPSTQILLKDHTFKEIYEMQNVYKVLGRIWVEFTRLAPTKTNKNLLQSVSGRYKAGVN
jgi:hypothetical protein